MECNVIKDLLPLYIDHCCSMESENLVKEHIKSCRSCRELYESMNTLPDLIPVASAPKKLVKINVWKASVLQSVLLFLSFAIITVGVALEAATPPGLTNGYWAFSLVVPATGFLLSLTNWYFVRLYKSRSVFSSCSLIATLSITVCAYIWAGFHYEDLLQNIGFSCGVGIFLTVAFCTLSRFLSNQYASMLGKE